MMMISISTPFKVFHSLDLKHIPFTGLIHRKDFVNNQLIKRFSTKPDD